MKTRLIFIHLFANFLKKYEKDVPKIINDEEHIWRIEDGVFPLQMLVGSHYMLQNPVEML